MCDECLRLQSIHAEAAERLLMIQREMATYAKARDTNIFLGLWKDSEAALKALWNIRDEMAKHKAALFLEQNFTAIGSRALVCVA
jgi:hypothetical protein